MSDTMATGSKVEGRTVKASMKTAGDDVSGDYQDFGGVQSKSMPNSFDSRSAALSDALGLKDSSKA